MSDFLQVTTLCANRLEAETIAERLVLDRLAACVQLVGPVTSTYRWQGRIERGDEWMCLIKTSAARYEEVERAIRQAHSYELPEIIATPIVVGSAAYLDWLRRETTVPPEQA